MSNRTRKSAINMSVGVLAQAMNLIVGFVSRSVFIHFLSAEYLGISGLLANVLTVLSFAELGIGEAMVYAMYKPAKENNQQLIRVLMKEYKKKYTIIACVVGTIGLALSFFADYLVVAPPKISENFQIIFLFYTANNVLSYFLTYKKSILIVDQKSYIVTIIAQATVLVQHVVQIAVLALTRQFYLYLVVQLACTAANNIVVSILVNKKYSWLNEGPEGKLPEEEREAINRNIKSLAIAKIAGVVSNGADNIIISKLLGLSTVGLVSNYTLITSSVSGILWNGLSSMTSSFGNFNVDSSIPHRRNLFDEIYMCAYWLYGFFTVGVITLANPLIALWLGPDFLLSNDIVWAMVSIVYVGGVNFPVYVYQTTLGMYDKMKYPYLASGVLNIVLSIVLGMKWGVFGIFLATILSRLCTSEAFGGYYVYKNGLALSPWRYVGKYVCSLAILVVNAFLTKFVVMQITIDGVMGFLIKMAVCTVVSNSIFFLAFFKTRAFKSLKNRAVMLLGKKIKA